MKGNKNSLKEMKGNSNKKKFIIVGACLLAVTLVIAIMVILTLMKVNNTKETEEADVSTVCALNSVNTESSKNDSKTTDKAIEDVVSTEKEIIPEISIKFLYAEDYWTKYQVSNTNNNTQQKYETTILSDIDQITTLLGKRDWYAQYADSDYTIYIKLVISDEIPEPREYLECPKASDTITPTFTIKFGYTMFRGSDLPFYSVLTSLITYDKKDCVSSFSKSLDAGLGEYIQNNLGKVSLVGTTERRGMNACNYGVDIQNFVKSDKVTFTKDAWSINWYKADVMKTMDNMGTTSATLPYSLQTIPGKFWLRSSYSFVDYLIKTYGLEKVVKVYDGKDEKSYETLRADGLKGLVLDWKKFIDEYPEMSQSEESFLITIQEGRSESYRIDNGYYK